MRKICLLTVLLVLTGFTPAKADFFLWQDPDFKYQVSFPDTWHRQTPDTPTTRMVVAGPKDHAKCWVKADTDRRAVIYPASLMRPAVNKYLDQNFWHHEIAQYDGAKLLELYESAGVGQGNATFAVVGYNQPVVSGESVRMRAMIFATLYDDMRYLIGCAATSDMFDHWHAPFMDVIGSSTFDPHYMPFPQGLYWRDYSRDKKLILRQGNKGTTHVDRVTPFTLLKEAIFY